MGMIYLFVRPFSAATVRTLVRVLGGDKPEPLRVDVEDGVEGFPLVSALMGMMHLFVGPFGATAVRTPGKVSEIAVGCLRFFLVGLENVRVLL